MIKPRYLLTVLVLVTVLAVVFAAGCGRKNPVAIFTTSHSTADSTKSAVTTTEPGGVGIHQSETPALSNGQPPLQSVRFFADLNLETAVREALKNPRV
jgi:predicted small lipoprotein YifL